VRPLGPAHRSFADPSRNILGSKLCAGATARPNFFGFFLFLSVWIFACCYSLLFLPSFLNSYILNCLSLLIFFSSYILNCLLYCRHDISVILGGFSRGPSLF
jgi:hypothetical protein